MRHKWPFIILGFLAFTLPAMGQVTALPAGSVVEGLTLEEWTTKWWQWQLGLETDANPLIDSTDKTGVCAHQGQSGPVFFIGGNLTLQPITNQIARRVTISSDKYILFPILNSTQENVGRERRLSAQELREQAQLLASSIFQADAIVDGLPVPRDRILRLVAPIFSYTLPATNNLFQYFDLDVPGGVVSPVAADGLYVMLAPLSPGEHIVQFLGLAGEPFNWGFGGEYRFTVVPPSPSYEVEVLVSLVRCNGRRPPDKETGLLPEEELSLLRRLNSVQSALKKNQKKKRKESNQKAVRELERFQDQVIELLANTNPEQALALLEQSQNIIDGLGGKKTEKSKSKLRKGAAR